MLSKYVMPGNKVEIQAVDKGKHVDDVEKKIYQTQVIDVLSEDRFEILVPMERTKLILLPVNTEYDMYFYTPMGIYQCFANVIDRYKTDSQLILLMELTSNLSKFQRREYYRLSCALEMHSRLLEKEEIDAVDQNSDYLVPGMPLKHSVIVDISGGGIRFVGDYAYEPNSLICCKYNLVVGGKSKEYVLVAKILVVKELEDKPGIYEHRAHYINIDTSEREEIIRFIFEEERKNMKREKDL